MAELSDEQRAFIAVHGIPLGLLFDASGMTRSHYQRVMKEEGKEFAFGVGLCNRMHKAIRSRAGHCMQCNPARLAFVFGEDAPANIYIAGSMLARLLKIGRSGDLESRLRNLNVESWADHYDWRLLAFAHCESAGRVERAVHGRLASWVSSCDYVQGRKRHHSYEVFSCNFADARAAVLKALPAGSSLNIPDEECAETNYNFR